MHSYDILCISVTSRKEKIQELQDKYRIYYSLTFKRTPSVPTKVQVIHCPNCGGNITEETEICEYCGSTLKEIICRKLKIISY